MNKHKTFKRRMLVAAALIGLLPNSIALWATYPSKGYAFDTPKQSIDTPKQSIDMPKASLRAASQKTLSVTSANSR